MVSTDFLVLEEWCGEVTIETATHSLPHHYFAVD